MNRREHEHNLYIYIACGADRDAQFESRVAHTVDSAGNVALVQQRNTLKGPTHS